MEVCLLGKGFRGNILIGSLSLILELCIVSLCGNWLMGLFFGEFGNCNNLELLYLVGNDFYGFFLNDFYVVWLWFIYLSLEYNR